MRLLAEYIYLVLYIDTNNLHYLKHNISYYDLKCDFYSLELLLFYTAEV